MEPIAGRALFPALEQQLFLNHAGIAPCSTRVAAAMRAVVESQATLGSRSYRQWSQQIAAIRHQAAAFIGATAGEIAFIPNTSTGMSLVAEALPWRPGEAVLVPTPDFPANIYPWRHLARRGVRVVDLPRRQGRIDVADVERALVPEARVLALSSVDFATGYAADLPAIGAFCREHGLLLVVDAIQSLGVLPIDVRHSGIHALACGAHKWLCGPQGIGVLYVEPELRRQLVPPLVGWKSVVDAEDFTLHFALRDDAAVFEPGTLNMAGIAGLGAALELLADVGIDVVRDRVFALTGQFRDGLLARGWQVGSPWTGHERSGIVAFAGKADPQKLFQSLDENGVVTALRDGRIRLSPHFANDSGDVARFFAVLDRLSNH
ncbi:MAG: aminotransferase class V-fold PLP-dependent enzyme [Desulfuromonadales bacterium]|nr:aminotransferase class V-fold PLP-dependent enzyme [Desulfuromonadales bacterium]